MENNFKHTKGEWFFEEKINLLESISMVMFSSKGTLLTKLIDDDSKTFEEIKANALLMSKASKMLKIIEELIAELSFHGYNHSTTIYNAKQLIKEATEL